jgi:hypothetical protein
MRRTVLFLAQLVTLLVLVAAAAVLHLAGHPAAAVAVAMGVPIIPAPPTDLLSRLIQLEQAFMKLVSHLENNGIVQSLETLLGRFGHATFPSGDPQNLAKFDALAASARGADAAAAAVAFAWLQKIASGVSFSGGPGTPFPNNPNEILSWAPQADAGRTAELVYVQRLIAEITGVAAVPAAPAAPAAPLTDPRA